MNAVRIKLGELCHVVTKGTTPTSVGFAFSESGVPFLRIQNLGNRTVDLSDVLYINDEANKALNRSRIQPKDFLITIAGTIGKVAIVPDDFPECNCNQAIAILRFDYEQLDPQYLLHWLATNDAFSQISGKKVTATISNLSLGQIKELKIPLPPLAEQQKIAAILDAADSLRQKDQQLVEHYTALSQSLFLEMFGDLSLYPSEQLKQISNFIDYRGKTPAKTTEGIPLLTAKNIKVGYISEEPREFISKDAYIDWMTRGFPKEGDVLFTTEAPLGQAALMPKYKEVAIAQRLICIQPSSVLNSYFLMNLIFSEFFMKQLFNRATGSTVKGVRSKELAKIEIPLVPIELQTQFADRIKVIEAQKQQAQASLAQSEALFNSLLHRAFTGELTRETKAA